MRLRPLLANFKDKSTNTWFINATTISNIISETLLELERFFISLPGFFSIFSFPMRDHNLDDGAVTFGQASIDLRTKIVALLLLSSLQSKNIVLQQTIYLVSNDCSTGKTFWS